MDDSFKKRQFWERLSPTSQRSLKRARQMFMGEVEDDYTDVVLRTVKAVEIELKRHLIFPCIHWARHTRQCTGVGEKDFGHSPEKLTLGGIRKAIHQCVKNLRWGFPVMPLDAFIEHHFDDGGMFFFGQEFLKDLDLIIDSRNRAAHQEGKIPREEAGQVWKIVIDALEKLIQNR